MNNIWSSLSKGKQLISALKKRITPKTAIIAVVILLVFAMGYSYKQLVIAAMVNGSPISRIAVIKQVEKMAGRDALERIIVEKLIEEDARKKSITVTDEEVDAAIKKLEDQLSLQGGTLDQALLAEKITLNDLKNQFMIQAKVEKILQDKITIIDEDVAKFIKDNKITVPKGEEGQFKDQIKNQLKQQKLNTEAGAWIESLKSQAKIRYFVDY